MKKTLLIPALALFCFACSGDESSAVEKDADAATEAVDDAADEAKSAIDEGAKKLEGAGD